jgi:hypothetical protein
MTFFMELQVLSCDAVVSSGKLLCPCGVLAGLFTAMDFQLNDEYVCRGVVRQSPATDGEDWSDQEHVLWTVIYAVALLIVAIVWIQLELLLLPDNTVCCSSLRYFTGGLYLFSKILSCILGFV